MSGGFEGKGINGTGGGGGAGQTLGQRVWIMENLQRKMSDRITALENGSLSKEQISDKLIFDKQREIEDLKRTVNQQAASMHNLYTKNQELENKLKGDEESYRIQQRLLCECEYRVKELSQDNDALQIKLKFFQDTSTDLGESNNRLREENHKLKEELSQWNTVLAEGKEAIRQNEVMQKNIDKITKANKYWEEQVEMLQKENADLKWRFDQPGMVKRQTARSCLGIISKIKNDSLTTASTSRDWMVAVCEHIEKTIKKEFDL
jgi:chromosome segregation ATPase